MKKDLLRLIKQIDNIRTNFHMTSGNGIPHLNIIYDTPVFLEWKQEIQFELQDIYDRTNDKFIWDTLVKLKQGFNGWKDEKIFNEISGSLKVVSKHISKYYPEEVAEITLVREKKEEIGMPQNKPKIFISHSSKDGSYVNKFVNLLEDIGLTEEEIICTSVSGYGIPLGEDIYDYLKSQFEKYKLHMIFILSDNYYKSVACMNEMGAAWILKNKCTTILLPGFKFKDIEGAINPREIGLKLDNDLKDVKERLGQLKDCLINEFGLHKIPDIRWEEKRDAFIKYVTDNGNTQISLENTRIKPCGDEEKNILIIPCYKSSIRIPQINDMLPIKNEILGNIKLNQIKYFALLQGTQDSGGVKIKYLVKGVVEGNLSKYKDCDYGVKIHEVYSIQEVHITSAIGNKNTLFSLEEIKKFDYRR